MQNESRPADATLAADGSDFRRPIFYISARSSSAVRRTALVQHAYLLLAHGCQILLSVAGVKDNLSTID
ncbi:MAG: hypothetical protein IKU86_10985, partial [Thermoguttaceae bacterium]|nr:hypothetical protein [Thermoguttaceae bacterium]